MTKPETTLIWPLIVYGGIVIFIVLAMIAISFVLGVRHKSQARNEPYESGIRPTGSAHIRFSTKYYLIALLFILFDVEAAIIFAWAVNFHSLGWIGYIEVVLFIVTLAVGLIYAWRIGNLDWYQTKKAESNESTK